MATEAFVRKFNNSLIPADAFSADALEGLKHGQVYKVELKANRRYKFLQKAFVLVGYAFDLWEPAGEATEYKGKPIEKNLERFREMLTIMAGHYTPVYKLDGSVQLIAKSWSYSSMPDDTDFSQLYNALLNVIIAKVISNHTGEELDEIVNNIVLGFS